MYWSGSSKCTPMVFWFPCFWVTSARRQGEKSMRVMRYRRFLALDPKIPMHRNNWRSLGPWLAWQTKTRNEPQLIIFVSHPHRLPIKNDIKLKILLFRPEVFLFARPTQFFSSLQSTPSPNSCAMTSFFNRFIVGVTTLIRLLSGKKYQKKK